MLLLCSICKQLEWKYQKEHFFGNGCYFFYYLFIHSAYVLKVNHIKAVTFSDRYKKSWSTELHFGDPTPAWHPIIPCLVPHLPMSGTPPVSGISPDDWIPTPCLEPYHLSGIPPQLEPHPLSGAQWPIWYPIPSAPLPQSYPQCPILIWPLTSPYPPSSPWLPHLELLLLPPSSCPTTSQQLPCGLLPLPPPPYPTIWPF